MGGWALSRPARDYSTALNRPRVLHVLWQLSEGGGIPIVVRQLAEGLGEERTEMHIATLRPITSKDRRNRLPDAVKLYGFDASAPMSMVQRARVSLKIGRLARKLHPDVVHAHSGTAAYAVPAVLLARPLGRILEVHDAPGNRRHGNWTERIEKVLVLCLGFRPLVHSTSVCSQVADAYGIPAGAMDLIPLGIDTSAFGSDGVPGRWRAELGGRPEVPIVLYVARHVPTKNVGLFVQVADRLREHVTSPLFVVIAGGEGRAEIEALVERSKLRGRVLLMEALFGRDLVTAYRDSDLFLSTSDYEGFGLAVLEAMAAGLPVVATAVGGATDLVVDGRTGLLAPRGDAEALAAAVATLLDDPERRTGMGRAGQELAQERFDVGAFTAAVGALYDRYRSGGVVDVALLKSADFGSTAQGAPTALPYRIDYLQSHGLRLHWTDRPHRRPWTSRPVAAVLAFQERLAPPLLQTALLSRRVARSPVTLALFESEANALAALRRAGAPPFACRKLAVIACWLAELLLHFSPRKRAWYRRTYECVDRLFYFSSNQGELFSSHLGISEDRLCFVRYGIDVEYFRPAPSVVESPYVLAVGRDRGRDWKTTFEGISGTGLRMKVLCRPRDLEGERIPSEVDVLGYVDRATYRYLLGQARMVVIATHDRAYPTGQSVFLEAMAMGRPCVVTQTRSLTDYLRPGTNALAVRIGDAAELRDAIVKLHDEPGLCQDLGLRAIADVRARFTAQQMWATIGCELRRLASHSR